MSFLDFLFPKKCIGCKKVGEYLCFSCFTKLSTASFVCLLCGNPCIDGLTHPSCKRAQGIDGVFCGFTYNGIVKKLVYSFKYQPYLSDLGEYLSELLYEQLVEQEPLVHVITNKPVFVPIPLSSKKFRKRGYNQSEVLAKKLAEKFNCSVENMLKRVKDTKPQFGLDREQRRENMQGAFAYHPVILEKLKASIEYQRKQHGSYQSLRFFQDDIHSVILVDDVLTTGSTLLEAAKVLKRSGVSKVYGVCLSFDS